MLNQRNNFQDIINVLERKPTKHPVIFEFYIGWEVIKNTLKDKMVDQDNPPLGWVKNTVNAYKSLGYGAAVLGLGYTTGFEFKYGEHKSASTVSQNDGGVIFDRESFETYQWPDPDEGDYLKVLNEINEFMPEGMKLIVSAPGGVMENLVNLVGFENLCIMISEDPDLLEDICKEIGTRINRFFERCMDHPVVGAAVIADDWGFKSSTMLSPSTLREYIFPYHRQIVNTIHSVGKLAILHSCGQVEDVMEDIICDLKYDAKHSFEDCILPVEEAYERWGDRIAILGGFDVHFLSTGTPEEIHKRSVEMLNRTYKKGGYALGSGNSITDYISYENYIAMISAANKF